MSKCNHMWVSQYMGGPYECSECHTKMTGAELEMVGELTAIRCLLEGRDKVARCLHCDQPTDNEYNCRNPECPGKTGISRGYMLPPKVTVKPEAKREVFMKRLSELLGDFGAQLAIRRDGMGETLEVLVEFKDKRIEPYVLMSM